jgi:hypothetical protein
MLSFENNTSNKKVKRFSQQIKPNLSWLDLNKRDKSVCSIISLFNFVIKKYRD